MPGFGRFETVEELASSGPFTVYSARSPGDDGPPKFAIKTFSTVDEFADPDMIEARASGFLESARAQQELAKSNPDSWAPVYDLGRTPTHAYFVTDLYELTAHKLIDSRRDMTPAEVVRMVLAVARALESLRSARNGRGHGDLKPTNVLIRAADNDLAQASVFLIDPAPEARLVNQGTADDQRSLADMLHQLVVFRPGPKGGTVQGGPEWSRLGKAGEILRAACEWLLNPQAGVIASYEEVRAKLEPAAQVKSGGSKKGLLIAGVAGVVLLGGAVAAWQVLGGASEKGNDHVDVTQTTDDTTPVLAIKKGEDPTPALTKLRDTALSTNTKKLADLQEALKGDDEGIKKVAELRAKVDDWSARTAGLIERAAAAWATPAAPADPAAQAAQQTEQNTIIEGVTAIDSEVRAASMSKAIDGLKDESFRRLTALVKARLEAAGGTEISQPALREGLKACLQTIVNDLGASDPSRGGYWDKYLGKMLAFEGYFKAIESGLPDLAPVPLPDQSQAEVEGLNKALATERAARVQAMIDGVVKSAAPKEKSEADAEIAQAKSALDDLRARMVATLADGQAIERLLALGFGLSEAPQEGKSLIALREQLASRDEVLRASVSKIIARVDDLERVTKLSAIPALMEVIKNASPKDVSKLVAAWTKLPDAGFPESVDDLATGAGLYASNVAPGLKAISDAQRQQALLTATREPLTRMWIGFAKKDVVADPKTLASLFGAMDSCGLRPQELGTKVGPFMAFNYARFKVLPEQVAEIRTRLAADPKKQSEAIAPLLAEFWARPECQPFKEAGALTGLRKTLKPFEEGKGFVDFAAVGPGVVGWSVSDAPDDASRVTYTKAGKSLKFVRVSPEEAESAAYLAATETPLSLFADLFSPEEIASGKLVVAAAPASDNRIGPRGWVVVDGKIVPAMVPPDGRPDKKGDWARVWGSGWLVPDTGLQQGGISQISDGVTVPGPTAETPVAYIGPAAALLAARKLNCRLPTPAEWTQAVSAFPPTDSNRRGPEWAKEHEYIEKEIPAFKKTNGIGGQPVFRPGGDIFRTTRPGPGMLENDKDPAVDSQDGWLWFRPVTESKESVIHDLVGNVAEFVLDDNGASASVGADEPSVSAAIKEIHKNKGVKVIGASALSQRELSPEKAEPLVTAPNPRGYSDVGFRLAFSTDAGGGSGKPADRLLAILAQAPYLAAKDAK